MPMLMFKIVTSFVGVFVVNRIEFDFVLFCLHGVCIVGIRMLS